VTGVDADAGSMAEASRRAARPVKRGGVPGALFVVAPAEALPAELDGRADALTVQFPWGSLLRGVLDADPAIVGGIARVTRPGATVTLLLSVTERERSIGRVSLDERELWALAPGYAAQGLRLCDARPATADQIAQAHSTWAKRLGAGTSRPAWLVRFERVSAAPCTVSAMPTGDVADVRSGRIVGR
jgi:16S rRNA (adenine(1408)-N(1))-methyltransferase